MSTEANKKNRIQEACKELESAIKEFEVCTKEGTPDPQVARLKQLKTQLVSIKKQLDSLSV